MGTDEKAKKPRLEVPKFASEAEEAAWWKRVRFSEYAGTPLTDRSRQRKVPPAKRSTTYPPPVSIRFDPEQIDAIKGLAERRGTNYQSIIKLWVGERLAYELRRQETSVEAWQALEELKADVDRLLEERVGAFLRLRGKRTSI